jgi:4-amino-4-deoxy-L-arabinose transferase-like glycosyltransferase
VTVRTRRGAALGVSERGFSTAIACGLLVAAITVAGLLLRLPSYNDSLFGDELSTYFVVTGHSLGGVLGLVSSQQEVTPPLFFILAWLTAKLGDPSETIRLTSLIAGTAAIPLTYALGACTVGRAAGVVGAALLALSPFQIFFSTEARAYELTLLVVLLSTLALLRALSRGGLRWWIAYGGLSCAAMYTHYAAAFVLVAQLGWALWTHREAWPELVMANGGATLAYLPWVPGYLDDRNGPNVIGFVEPFGLHAIRAALENWSIGHPYISPTVLPGSTAVALALAGVLLGTVGMLMTIRRHRGTRWRPSDRAVLVVLLAIATPVGVAIYSAHGPTIWQSKNLIASSPGLALAAGGLLTSGRGLLRTSAVALVLAAFAIGGAKMLASVNQRPDYKGVARYIERTGGPGDPVVEVPFTANPLSGLQVALAKPGRWTSGQHPTLRVGIPKLRTQLRARAKHLPQLAPLPVPKPEVLARDAARDARGGKLFVVALGAGELPSQRAATRSMLAEVLKDLPSRFQHVATKTYQGLGGHVPLFMVSVYVFRDTGGSG